MDADAILKQLREEHAMLTEAIASLERLAAGRQKNRRGRPPTWLMEAKAAMPKRRGRPPGNKTRPSSQ